MEQVNELSRENPPQQQIVTSSFHQCQQGPTSSQCQCYSSNILVNANPSLDISRCEEIEVDKGRPFGLKAYSKSLKRFIKFAVWYPNEADMTKWQIYFSTDESMSTKNVINCYRTRFQLEFYSRDAKHYVGLNDCQSTDLRKLEFHRNASFASINIAKATCKELGIPFSISSCKSIIHNAYMLNRFICVSGLQPDPQVIDKLFKELVLFTARAA